MNSKKSCFLALICVAATSPLHGAAITLKAGGDGGGTTSFNAALNWDPAVAPSTGNTYAVSVNFLRTPADANNYAFGGDSLTLNAGGAIIHKGTAATNTYTIANFVLNGGFVRSGAGQGNTLAFAGGLTVNGTGSYFLADQSPFIIGSITTGTGDLGIQGGYPLTFTAANTFTGKLTLSQTGTGTTLAENSHWKFAVGANGVNNTITGAGVATFNGIFDIDLSAASTTIGDHWTLVDVATLTETFGGTFSIAGFTENNGIWTDSTGRYQFREATGVLTAITTDTDGDGLPDAWEKTHFGSLDAGATDDSDSDHANNLLEYQSATDPNNPASYPDTDGDGLNDGWELNYFGNLAQAAAGDPDGDFVSNLDEFKADSSPASAASYPDADFDGINDGWEIHYFGSIAACNPDLDPDGDLFTNIEEFQNNPQTDPKVQISSPDTDADGLADGWELKNFRVGSESLETAIARQGGKDDPDGDSYDNLAEFRADTNPKSASSHPSELAYWRFEEAIAGPVPTGPIGGGTINTILDSSGLGNHMKTYLDYTAPIYSPTVPFATVPLTGTTNTASLAFIRDPANNFVTDNIYTNDGAYVNQYKFNAFTVEATFNTSVTNLWQVVIGKSGNPIAGQSPFTMKIDTTNHLRAGIVDGAGVAKEAISTRSITPGTWYSVAITASTTELKLWIKTAIDAKYVLEATTPIGGAFYDYAGVNAPWVIGLGKWNGVDADPFGGNIDEVRISPKVLDSTAFLVPDAVLANDSDNDGMDDAWEISNFGSLDEAADGDPDGDYASNFLEFKNGTNPTRITSYPDTDGDGLSDGWEYRFFGNLTQGAAGDPDADYSTNLHEFQADSSPVDKFSYPDTDFDGINDGWEFHYFAAAGAVDTNPQAYAAALVAGNPEVDVDGDLFTNLEEFQATTDPLVQTSSPDTDGDTLPDGWEVKYFRVGTEGLAAAIAHQGGTGDPDGDRLSNYLEFKAGTHPSDAASVQPTLGYWRFEEMVAGEVPAGGNGAYAFPNSITDSSPYGNPMMSWADYSRPNYVAEVPAPTVPATGAANTASLYFLRNGNDIRYFMESLFTTPANLLAPGQGFLSTLTLPEYTVEASFKTTLTGVWQVPICKQGNPVGGQPPFTLKIDTANKLRAGMVDGSGVAREIIGTTTIAAGSWYSSAVTATATELKLWLKGPADTSYHLEGQLPIVGAWYVPAAGPLNTTWNIGGGQWNGLQADAFQGDIDEVRLSAVALAPEKFLFYTASSSGAYADWAAAQITDASRRLETDDADGDGTSNLTEFRLGLNPGNGASRFAAAQAGDGTMTWPSAAGVTFSVQRSDTMAAGSWTKIATIPGTAGNATFKDLTPPAGKAFYRILLEP